MQLVTHIILSERDFDRLIYLRVDDEVNGTDSSCQFLSFLKFARSIIEKSTVTVYMKEINVPKPKCVVRFSSRKGYCSNCPHKFLRVKKQDKKFKNILKEFFKITELTIFKLHGTKYIDSTKKTYESNASV